MPPCAIIVYVEAAKFFHHILKLNFLYISDVSIRDIDQFLHNEDVLGLWNLEAID